MHTASSHPAATAAPLLTDPPPAAGPVAMAPDEVVRVARDWEAQHVDLRVAAEQVAHAPTSGFTPPVARAAADFLRAWTAHAGAAAELAEHEAEALRSVLAAWLRADERAGARAQWVLAGLEALR